MVNLIPPSYISGQPQYFRGQTRHVDARYNVNVKTINNQTGVRPGPLSRSPRGPSAFYCHVFLVFFSFLHLYLPLPPLHSSTSHFSPLLLTANVSSWSPPTRPWLVQSHWQISHPLLNLSLSLVSPLLARSELTLRASSPFISVHPSPPYYSTFTPPASPQNSRTFNLAPRPPISLPPTPPSSSFLQFDISAPSTTRLQTSQIQPAQSQDFNRIVGSPPRVNAVDSTSPTFEPSSPSEGQRRAHRWNWKPSPTSTSDVFTEPVSNFYLGGRQTAPQALATRYLRVDGLDRSATNADLFALFVCFIAFPLSLPSYISSPSIPPSS